MNWRNNWAPNTTRCSMRLMTRTQIPKMFRTSTSNDNGSRKDKRPNIGPAAWRHQNRDALNEAHMPFDFDELFLLFFFVAITLLLAFDAPYPSKQWRIANERRMNRL